MIDYKLMRPCIKQDNENVTQKTNKPLRHKELKKRELKIEGNLIL